MASPIHPAIQASPDYPFIPVQAPVKLDQNESPEDFPVHLKALVGERLRDIPWNRYPELHSDVLCEAIGRHEGWPESGVVITTGSNVLIPLLTQLAGLGKRVVTVKPNFALYALGARLLDLPLTEVALKADFALDVPALMTALRGIGDGEGGVLFLSQPHAPSGTLASHDDIATLVDAVPSWLVVIDEAYCHFSDRDFKDFARQRPNVALLRTFSKAWGLAGLRLGYVLASGEVAKHLRKLIPPFAISVMQTVAAQVALEHPAYMMQRAREVIEERQRVFKALQDHPHWTIYPSEGNFLLIRAPDVAEVFNRLLQRGVLVRRQDSYFGLAGCLRVSIGTRAENDRFLAAALSTDE
jgi:histidinol-phosphate aminotransferase